MHKEIYLPLLWDRTLAGGSPAYFRAVTDCGGVDGGQTTGCQGDQHSCNARVDPSPPTGDWHCPPGLLHTAQGLRALWTPIVLYRYRSYLLTSAGISQCTLHFFYCSVNWQQCGIIVPLGLIQCAFGYQCHSVDFKQRFSPPFTLKDSWWFSCTCLSIAQRYFPNLIKWDMGISGHTVEVVHAVWTLSVFYTMIWGMIFQQGCLSKRQQLLQWHRTSVFSTAFMLS